MKHLLLKTAFNYKKRTLIKFSGFIYDKQIGVWLDEISGELLARNKKFPGIATKKEDIETGEDQKGQ